MAGACQSCDGCCRVLEVKEISKSFGSSCRYLTQRGACEIYPMRPDACAHYVCLWLDSQRRPNTEALPERLRPDACHVVMGWPYGVDLHTLHVYPYPDDPDAWKREPVRGYLESVLKRGAKLVVFVSAQEIYSISRGGQLVLRGTEAEFAQLMESQDVDSYA